MKYSIIIPTYNHCDDLLKPCLQSIIDYTDLTEVEVIVIANGCVDNTREYVNSLGHPFKLIWITEPVGFVRATNEGIQASSGEYVIFLNNDTELTAQPKSSWLRKLQEPFNNPYIGITGPSLKFHHKLNSYGIIFFCAMIPRHVITQVGMLDDAYSPGGVDDFDYSQRVIRCGYSLKEIPIELIHKENQTFKEKAEEYKNILYRNESYFRRKFKGTDKYLNEKNAGASYLKYSIIIPTSDGCDTFLKPCVESIFKYSEMAQIELIVSAYDCTDNTKQYLSHLQATFESLGFVKNLKVVWGDENTTYAMACNSAIEVSRTDLIIFLNPDAILLSQHRNFWLSSLEHSLNLNPSFGIACLFTNFYQNLEYADLCCAMVRKSVLTKVKNFTTDYEQSRVEILDFSAKIYQNGYYITKLPDNFPIYYNPVMVAEHSRKYTNWDDIVARNHRKLIEKVNSND